MRRGWLKPPVIVEVIQKMDNKKKLLVVGAAVLMVLGVVIAANATGLGKQGFAGKGWMKGGMGRHGQGNMTSFLSNLGLPNNATRQQISDAAWAKELKDLGLTDSSTLAEYRQALKAKMQSNQGQRMQDIGAKLNLPANATKADIQNAMKQWRAANKELLPGKGRMPGFGMGRETGFAGGCKGLAPSSETGG
jgi:Spy/CpxP family protein refolding chaperone